jgi:uncharacterized protein
MHNLQRSSIETYSIRLKPGDDISKCIEEICKDYSIQAGVILSCVGSLQEVSLRYAGEPETTPLKGPFEIVSLTGTISVNGSHLHISVSDKTGKTIGGHLKPGNSVYTTIELTLGVLPSIIFTREKDDNELFIKQLPPK